MQGILKFEGESRMTLDTVVGAVGMILGNRDKKEVKKKFMRAIKTNGVIVSIVDMIKTQEAKDARG